MGLRTGEGRNAGIITDRGDLERIESDNRSWVGISVRSAHTGEFIPGLEVQAVFRSSEEEYFGPYGLDLLFGVDSACYGASIELPDGYYTMEVFIVPFNPDSRLERVVGRVKAVFEGLEVA